MKPHANSLSPKDGAWGYCAQINKHIYFVRFDQLETKLTSLAESAHKIQCDSKSPSNSTIELAFPWFSPATRKFHLTKALHDVEWWWKSCKMLTRLDWIFLLLLLGTCWIGVRKALRTVTTRCGKKKVDLLMYTAQGLENYFHESAILQLVSATSPVSGVAVKLTVCMATTNWPLPT